MAEHNVPDSLINALFEKASLIKGGKEHKHIKTAIVVLGGAMRGVIGASQTLALHRVGLGNVFDYAVGSSAGAATLAYFLAGEEQNRLGLSLFYQELAENKFINPLRFWNIEDVDFLIRCFSIGSKKLDISSLSKNCSVFWIALTHYHSGRMELWSGKRARVLELLRASVAIPGFYNKEIFFDDQRYIDGDVSFDIEKAVRKTGAKYVLILTNRAWGTKYLTSFESLATYALPGKIRSQLLLRRKRSFDGIKNLLEDKDLCAGVLWAPKEASDLHKMCNDSKKLRSVAVSSAKSTVWSFLGQDLDVSII